MQQSADMPRAHRYDLSAPVLFRQVGEGDWSTGRTVNVSRTGVLFTECSRVPRAAAEVEFVLMLPGLGHPGSPGCSARGGSCAGAAAPSDAAVAVAVTIERIPFLGLASDTAQECTRPRVTERPGLAPGEASGGGVEGAVPQAGLATAS